MDQELIRLKFGNKYIADDMTFKMGIDIRFTDYLASRFKNMIVLETCTGGGFSTISLAKYAKHVYSFEIGNMGTPYQFSKVFGTCDPKDHYDYEKLV